MGKRFTETTKWTDVWFRKLSPLHKLAWGYLCDNCDAAGVIELDEALADFQIGESVPWGNLCDLAGGRIVHLDRGKIWLSKFVFFQYPNGISKDCRAHRPIYASLCKHGLLERVLEQYSDSSRTVHDTDTDKDKEKDTDKGGVGEKRFVKPTVEEVEAYCQERGNGISGQDFVDSYERVGWVVGRNRTPMKNWKAAVHTWENERKKKNKGPRLPTAKEDAEWSPI